MQNIFVLMNLFAGRQDAVFSVRCNDDHSGDCAHDPKPAAAPHALMRLVHAKGARF